MDLMNDESSTIIKLANKTILSSEAFQRNPDIVQPAHHGCNIVCKFCDGHNNTSKSEKKGI